MPGSADSAGYSGTPLPKKLGIKPDSVVALLGAPRNFADRLGPLPDGARVRNGGRGASGLVVWFVRSRKELERNIAGIRDRSWTDGLWIAWAKQSSPLATDVTETHVRAAGLAAGLVDYKVCAIDADWSGLKFARRKTK